MLHLAFILQAKAGVLSDFHAGNNVALRSTVKAGFSGNNPVAHIDYASDFDTQTTTPTGSHSTSATATHTPPATHAPGDHAVGTTSLVASFAPGGQDTLSFSVAGSAKATNAHNFFNNEANGDVEVRSQIEWFVWYSGVPNKIVAGKLHLPALPPVPDGVTLSIELTQQNCCPPTVAYSAPHPATTVDIWHGYGYILSMTLLIDAPFGGDTVSFNFDYPVTAEATLPGDYNSDGVVEVADYVLWRKTNGTSGSGLAADGSGPTIGVPDSTVDQHDYNYWRANYGTSAGAGSASNSPVPEPTTALIATMFVALLALNRRRSPIRDK
jgi:hypothetical protein